MANDKHASEKVVIAAPMSFAGSAQRIWKITDVDNGAQKALLGVVAVLLIIIAWLVVICWYLLFGLLLVPYRLIRRGSRKRKMEGLRHREQLGQMQEMQKQQQLQTSLLAMHQTNLMHAQQQTIVPPPPVTPIAAAQAPGLPPPSL